MYHIADDQRARRSAQAIADALYAAIDAGDYATLKITTLAAGAGLGRATFYRNFDALEDVLRWQCDVTLERLAGYVRANLHDSRADGPYPLLRPFLRFFHIHSRIIEILIAVERTDILQTALAREIAKMGAALPPLPDVHDDYLEYRPVMRAAMTVSVLVHWIGQNKRHPPDELAEGLSSIAREMTNANALV